MKTSSADAVARRCRWPWLALVLQLAFAVVTCRGAAPQLPGALGQPVVALGRVGLLVGGAGRQLHTHTHTPRWLSMFNENEPTNTTLKAWDGQRTFANLLFHWNVTALTEAHRLYVI